jgi:hypothetical protein
MPERKLELVGKEVDFWGSRGQLGRLGDRFVLTDDLTAITIDTAPFPPGGQHFASGVLVREPSMWLVEAGFMLPGLPSIFTTGGQIQVRGLMEFPGDPPWSFRAAITGGTQDYRHAQGDLQGNTRDSDPPTRDWTFMIETP